MRNIRNDDNLERLTCKRNEELTCKGNENLTYRSRIASCKEREKELLGR
jgi:hypothetical protein